jgi:hypothetical protein
MLDRLGLGRGDRENQDLRFCKCHPVEEKRFSIKYTIRNEDEEGKTNETFSETKLVKGLPKPVVPKSSETPATLIQGGEEGRGSHGC